MTQLYFPSNTMPHAVTLITGDGTGPELARVAQQCIDATGVSIQWDIQEAGSAVFAREGTPLPEKTIESLRRTRCALKAPVTTPVGTGFRSVNVYLRQTLDLFACVRPCKLYPGVRTPFAGKNIDLVVIRENTEDLYAGIEFCSGADVTAELIEFINDRSSDAKILTSPKETGLSIKPISRSASQRILQFAFSYAKQNHRCRITCVHKANIMKHTDGLWLEEAQKVAREFPEIQFDDCIVDNLCMQLVRRPEEFDILVLPNLYGDIVSDLAAGLVGGLGVAPGMNIGTGGAVFEATHGSAPKYAGLNKVNPTALILSGVLMLRYLGENSAANRLEQAVAQVIAEGSSVTYDLIKDGQTPVGTTDMADAICRKLEKSRVL